MKKILVTYHFAQGGVSCENCTVLSIDIEVADRLIAGGQSGIGRTVLNRIIRDLITLQGGMSLSNDPIVDIREATNKKEY